MIFICFLPVKTTPKGNLMIEKVTPIVYTSRSGRSFVHFVNASSTSSKLALCLGGTRFNMLAVLSEEAHSRRTVIGFEDPQQGMHGKLIIRRDDHGTEIWFNDEIFMPSAVTFDPRSLVPLPDVRRVFGLAEHPDGRLLYVNCSKYGFDMGGYQLHVGSEETMRRVELKQLAWRDVEGLHLDAVVGHLTWPLGSGRALPTMDGVSLDVKKWYDVVQPPGGEVAISLYA